MHKITLTKGQEDTLKMLSTFLEDESEDAKYMVVQGDSGTGKSTIIDRMCALIKDSPTNMRELLVTATTNKAVDVLRKMLDGIVVSTIHSQLKLVIKPDIKTGKEDLTPCTSDEILIANSIIIVDEASFISDELFQYLDKGTWNCKIILVGDQFQLAPVDQDVIIMSKLETPYKSFLTEIVRNKGNISELGCQFKASVSSGKLRSIKDNNVDIITLITSEFEDKIKEVFSDEKYTPKTARILAWTNKKVLEYGKKVRVFRGEPEQFFEGEAVFTNKPIFGNGDSVIASTDSMVYISKIIKPAQVLGIQGNQVYINDNSTKSFFLPDNQEEAKKKLQDLANKKDWSKYFQLKKTWLDLRAPYASTVHKSQGSEYETVFIDVYDIRKCKGKIALARLLYVAITRATKTVYLLGHLSTW